MLKAHTYRYFSRNDVTFEKVKHLMIKQFICQEKDLIIISFPTTMDDVLLRCLYVLTLFKTTIGVIKICLIPVSSVFVFFNIFCVFKNIQIERS